MIVLVAGGSGFLGSRVVEVLKSRGHDVIVYHRTFRAVPTQADAIVNCVGIIRERGETFQEVHVDLTKWLLGLGRKLGVRQFVQVSALGVRSDGVPYQRTKARAEAEVMNSGLPYAIIRPSMLFGPKDRSINTFRAIARTGFFPVLTRARVQPVHVDTIAQVIAAAVEKRVRNRVVEVGGPEIFTYRQLAKRIHPGVITFHLPGFIVGLLPLFSWLTSKLPTRDMLRMLREDNITRDLTVQRLRIKNPRLR